jgi:hypothetical protein
VDDAVHGRPTPAVKFSQDARAASNEAGSVAFEQP